VQASLLWSFEIAFGWRESCGGTLGGEDERAGILDDVLGTLARRILGRARSVWRTCLVTDWERASEDLWKGKIGKVIFLRF